MEGDSATTEGLHLHWSGFLSVDFHMQKLSVMDTANIDHKTDECVNPICT